MTKRQKKKTPLFPDTDQILMDINRHLERQAVALEFVVAAIEEEMKKD